MSASEPLESADRTEVSRTPLLTGVAQTRSEAAKISAFAGDVLPSLAHGSTIEDYEILRELGAGGFARVYLARQISLDRLVALKVSLNSDSEARTLAKLEHHHIVQVFAEFVDPSGNLRLLCMQFVPGVTLARAIAGLRQRPMQTWSGRTFLTILDQTCTEATTLDLAGLGIRGSLENCDHAELTCWLGARLAEALDHAHSRGVIHRDVKPANILVNRYGRPFLADFNIALNTQSGEGTFGGTLSYMAPEHLEALLINSPETQRDVDARADLYSLALVLFEFLTGQLPFTSVANDRDAINELIRVRQAGAPSPRQLRPDVPDLIDRLLRRCLDPAPAQRFQSAAAFLHALDGCRELLQIEKEPDQQDRFVQSCQVRPFTWLLVLAILPNVVGSVVNVVYNTLIIVDKNPAQQASFEWLILAYNVVVYPVLALVAIVVIRRAYQGWRRLREPGEPSTEESALSRRRVLALPGWIVAISCLGWFPGGVVFPVGLSLGAGSISIADSIHFAFSFVISGLIASTYVYFGVLFIVLRILYPQMWPDPSRARQQATDELNGLPRRLRRFQMLAVLIPLLGATLLITAGPDQLSIPFRALVTSLIVLGLAGFALATRVCHRLNEVLALLTNARDK